MNGMQSRNLARRRWVWVALLAMTGSLACGTSGSTVEGETHWLSRCTPDVSCGGGFECLCGVCTRSCTDDSSCSDLGPDAACQLTQDSSLANDCESGTPPRLCTRPGSGNGTGGSTSDASSSTSASTTASSSSSNGASNGGTAGAPSTNATSSGGTSSSSAATNGTGGSTSSSTGAGGSAGMGGACSEELPGAFPECECYEDADCPVDTVCYAPDCAQAIPGRCEVPPLDGCYGDRDCGEGEVCAGGSLARCGSLGPDSIGACGPAICPCEPGECGENEQMCLMGEECILSQGPQNNGICRGADGTCFECECTAANTPVATPAGARAIAELRPGDIVYSVHDQQIRAVPVLRINRVPVKNHSMLRVRFASGAVIEMSPGHPTADDMPMASLSLGQELAGERVIEITSVPYAEPYTHDILPDSDSGSYFADGVLVGSTLFGH